MTKVHPCCWSNNFSIYQKYVCPQRVRSIIAHARERVNPAVFLYQSSSEYVSCTALSTLVIVVDFPVPGGPCIYKHLVLCFLGGLYFIAAGICLSIIGIIAAIVLALIPSFAC